MNVYEATEKDFHMLGNKHDEHFDSSQDDKNEFDPVPKRSRFWRNATLVGIPVAAIAILVSRPFVSLAIRETCYWMHGPSQFWPNPLGGAWHWFRGVQQCEWAGELGFHWYDVVNWLGERGQSIVTTMAGIGGSYAIWRGGYQFFKKPKMEPHQVEKLKILADNLKRKEISTGAGQSARGYHPMLAVRRGSIELPLSRAGKSTSINQVSEPDAVSSEVTIGTQQFQSSLG